MDFHFQVSPTLHKEAIIFAKIDKIFSLNFITQEIEILYEFS